MFHFKRNYLLSDEGISDLFFFGFLFPPIFFNKTLVSFFRVKPKEFRYFRMQVYLIL